MKLGQKRGAGLRGIVLLGALLWTAGGLAAGAWARSQGGAKSPEPSPSVINLPFHKLIKSVAELKGLQPAGNQQPLQHLLQETGRNVANFFRTFPDTTSDELVREQRFRRDGSVDEAIAEEFRYLALTKAPGEGAGLREYRTSDKGGPVERQGMRGPHILTQGFISAIIIFDPAYRAESLFRYLGRETWQGKETEVVAFAQQTGRATPVQSVEAGGKRLEILLQGIAWIDSSSGQIVALRTDLLRPYREIRLDRQTTQLDFAPVRFQRRSKALWLPHKVVVKVVWGDLTFRNTHEYSNYRLFQGKTQEKTRLPGKS